MSSEWIVGALAFFTIGAVVLISVYHFGTFLKDPQNRGAAANVAAGNKAASTRVAEEAPVGSYHDRTLKERLDDSPASAHPLDPDKLKNSRPN